MPRKKRPYSPKIKGCYECSQRRIHCDRTEPECRKCTSKGLKCSGLSVRHRFNNGVASRGKWTGKTMQVVYQEMKGHERIERQRQERETIPTPGESSQDEETTPRDFTEDLWECLLAVTSAEDPFPGGLINSEGSFFLESSSSSTALLQFPESDRAVDTLALTNDAGNGITACSFSSSGDCLVFQPSPDNLSPWERLMLLHFSDSIAKEMVAIDGLHNGWRHLILPAAHADELVMNAVLAVSAFHQSLSRSPNSRDRQDIPRQLGDHHGRHRCRSQQPDPDQLYARAIMGLRQRQGLRDCDLSSQHSILLTILVLLTAVMVTGYSDFPTLLRMLQSALDAIGGEQGLGGSEMAEFIIRQVHKMRVYAAPLLSEQTGLETISSQDQIAQFFDCLNHCSQQRPEHALAVSFVTDIVHQARDIYLQQVLKLQRDPASSPPGPSQIIAMSESIGRVQRFKETLEAFPHGSPGQQVLVWATFVAASDCLLDEHKAFFEGVLLEHYARNGFVNLLRAIEYLRKIWARSPEERWTTLLPQARVFVM